MPRAEIRAVTTDPLVASKGFETGEIDMLIGMLPSLPPGCLAEQLFEDGAVCVARKDHPHSSDEMTLEELVRHSHIHTATTATADRRLEATLAERGLKRRIALTVPELTIAATVASRTDYLLPIAHRMAQALTRSLTLRIIRVPDLDSLPRLTTSLVWHARTDPEPGARELRDIIRSAASTLPALSPRTRKKTSAARPLTKRRSKPSSE
jgi:DNA-binding transcriptional LysR family regulator